MLSVQSVPPHGHSLYVYHCPQEANQMVLRKNSHFMHVFIKEEWEVEEGKGGQIYGDGRRLDFGL